MNPPRSKLRGIQQLSILTQIILVAAHVVAGIHFLDFVHIFVSFLHFHIALLLLHNIHLTKIPLPTTSFLPQALV